MALVVLASLLAIGATWIYVVEQIDASHRRALLRAQHDARDFASLLRAHVVEELEAADDLLRFLADVARGGADSGRSLLAKLKTDGARYHLISISDARGLVVGSTLRAYERTSIARRDYFERARLSSQEAELVVGKPFRVQGRTVPSIPAARKWVARDGAFGGVVEALLNPEHLANYFEGVHFGARGVVMLADLEGTVLARDGRERAGDASDAATLREGVLPRARTRASSTYVEYDGEDRVARVVSYSSIEQHRLVVLVGKSADEVFEEYVHLRRNWIYSGAAISALLSTVAALAVIFLRQEQRTAKALASAFEAEHANARTDSMTGLPNRRAFQDLLVAQIEYHRRHDQPLSLAYFDCDRFKEVNDRLGHEAGDRCLIDVATILAKGLRRSDYACRIGGDEFAAMFPSTRSGDAAMVMERVRAKVAALFAAQGLPVTISVGVIEVDDLDADPAALITQTDAVMYQAKRTGGDRVLAMPSARRRTAKTSEA
jgi:diguanylate cyclase (GGDEF)-like protein